jgi:hypothetical protein
MHHAVITIPHKVAETERETADVTKKARKAVWMRTAAHSCLMRRKSLGGARSTAATTELNESDDACDASVPPSPVPARDDADDELRHSRAHLRPLLHAAFSVAFRPTSDLIHFPDCPIAAATTRDAAACSLLCSAEASFRFGSRAQRGMGGGEEGEEARDRKATEWKWWGS